MTRRKRFNLPGSDPAVIFAGFFSLLASAPVVMAGEMSGLTPILIEKVSVSRQFDLLRAICDPGQVALRNGAPVCGTCPSFTSGGSPGLSITNAIEGNFTRAGTKEVLLDTRGCEPTTAAGGGSILLESGEGGWSRKLYLPGFRSNECVRFRTLQQTVSLACNMSTITGGIQRGKLEWLNLRNAKQPVRLHLLDWYDNSQSNPRRLVSIFPHRFMKSDFNSDGRVDLQVNLRLRDESVPDKYPGYIEAIAANHRFAKAKPLRLVYLFDGSSLTLSPNSEATKAGIDNLIKRSDDQRH